MVSADWVKHHRRGRWQVTVYQYQKDCRYFAQITDSLKEAGAEELSELGVEDVRTNNGDVDDIMRFFRI